jgi:hypothetical protein
MEVESALDREVTHPRQARSRHPMDDYTTPLGVDHGLCGHPFSGQDHARRQWQIVLVISPASNEDHVTWAGNGEGSRYGRRIAWNPDQMSIRTRDQIRC